MNREVLQIYAHGGDALSAPANTETAFMAALGVGATGLACPVCLTTDGVVVCSEDASIRQMDWHAARQLDAGADFCSVALDGENRPTGLTGKDRPWASSPKGAALCYPTLERVLVAFGRFCPIIVMVDHFDEPTVVAVANLLERFGLDRRVRILGNLATCEFLSSSYPDVPKILRVDSLDDFTDLVHRSGRLGISDFCVDWGISDNEWLIANSADFTLWFSSRVAYAPTAACIERLCGFPRVGGCHRTRGPAGRVIAHSGQLGAARRVCRSAN